MLEQTLKFEYPTHLHHMNYACWLYSSFCPFVFSHSILCVLKFLSYFVLWFLFVLFFNRSAFVFGITVILWWTLGIPEKNHLTHPQAEEELFKSSSWTVQKLKNSSRTPVLKVVKNMFLKYARTVQELMFLKYPRTVQQLMFLNC